MAATYRNAREHLDDQIALIAQLIERQIRAHWELGILPPIKDEFSGTFVSGDEVKALLSGGRPATSEGQKRIAALDAAINARAERIEAKLKKSREERSPLPFDRLRSTFQLSPTEQRALWVLIAIEVSSRLRHLMRYLVNEASRIHADVGLLEMLVYSSPATRDLMITELAPDSRLFEHRLLEPVGSKRQNEDAPYLLRPLRVSRRVIELAHGLMRLDRDVAAVATLVKDPPSFDDIVIHDDLKQEIGQLFRVAGRFAKAGQTTPVVVLAGLEGSGRKSLAFGAANAIGSAALHVRCSALPTDATELRRLSRSIIREAILHHAVPVFEGLDELAPMPEIGRPDRGRLIDAAVSKFLGPVAATCEPLDSRPLALSRGVVLVDVPVPTEADRVELWNRAFGASAPLLDIALIAARYPITGGIVIKTAAAAMLLAEARGTPKGTNNRDVHVGLRSTLDSKLSALGKRVTWRQGWDDLVLPQESIDEILEFIARVKHRRRVYDDWGFAVKMAKGLGLSALFAGPPGTGKTMVAGIIAHELSLDLYQIDLSRIVSKYVGETEKNLANLFDAAEAGHAILLFDEADSLFAKRTEVKSSVDRYANLEVNYLLQRMEAFNGITILTTNLDSSIDDAFRRRISFRVDFPFPESEDRERLWQAMFPRQAAVADDIDFFALSEKYEMSGGYIRNAVLRAAFLAAEDDSSISMRHLKRAANLEYQAMGKIVSSL